MRRHENTINVMKNSSAGEIRSAQYMYGNLANKCFRHVRVPFIPCEEDKPNVLLPKVASWKAYSPLNYPTLVGSETDYTIFRRRSRNFFPLQYIAKSTAQSFDFKGVLKFDYIFHTSCCHCHTSLDFSASEGNSYR